MFTSSETIQKSLQAKHQRVHTDDKILSGTVRMSSTLKVQKHS